jgi:hypothetical protein
MAMFAYIDDSGSDPSQPLYVLGGLILPEETWAIFADDWKHVLGSDPAIEYFKGSEVWDKQKGPFAALTTRERSAKVDALADVIFTYKPLAIACHVEWEIFKEFSDANALVPELDDPYFFLFFALHAQVIQTSRQILRFSPVNFVFDEQGEVGNKVQLWYSLFLAKCVPQMLALLGRDWPAFGDEKKDVQLQAADMFAWYRRRNVLGSLGHESHQRIWERFRETCFTGILQKPQLFNMARDLNAFASFYDGGEMPVFKG